MFSSAHKIGSSLVSELNEKLAKHSPAKIIAGTLAAVALIQNASRICHAINSVCYGNVSTRDIARTLIDKSYGVAIEVPLLGDKVLEFKDKEVKKFLTSVQEKFLEDVRNSHLTQLTMPKKGLPHKEILASIATDLQVHNHRGKQSGSVYADHDSEMINLLGEVYKLTAFTNPMHSTWPKLNAMEAQMLCWFHQLFGNHATPSVNELPRVPPGFITDGGTTSILEACRAYVRYAKQVLGIANPVIIVPTTAHVAFDNAADALGARLIKVPVNRKTGAADVKAMENCITYDTCLLVGSAPSFPCGIFDPIEGLAKVALKHKIPLHVDACLGGFYNAFAEKAGYPVPRFDFSVPGVSSLSADPHKYGLAPKGSSVVLFHPKCAATSVFSQFDWLGGIYVTPGLKGSRRGDAISSLWAVLNAMGENQYVEITRQLTELTLALAQKVQKVSGIVLRYTPQFPVLTFDAQEGINNHVVASQLIDAHWEVNLINPTGFHFCLTHVHVNSPHFVEDFLNDLTAAVDFAKANPTAKPKNMAKVYGTLGNMIYPTEVLKEVGERYAAIKTTLPHDLVAAISGDEFANESKEAMRVVCKK